MNRYRNRHRHHHHHQQQQQQQQQQPPQPTTDNWQPHFVQDTWSEHMASECTYSGPGETEFPRYFPAMKTCRQTALLPPPHLTCVGPRTGSRHFNINSSCDVALRPPHLWIHSYPIKFEESAKILPKILWHPTLVAGKVLTENIEIGRDSVRFSDVTRYVRCTTPLDGRTLAPSEMYDDVCGVENNLVGGFNPFEKIIVKLEIFQIGAKIKIFETTTQ